MANNTGNERHSVFKAFAQQQRVIEEQGTKLRRQASVNSRLNSTVQIQGRQIEALGTGLQALCAALGPRANQIVLSAMTRTADIHNPAQPVPEPPAQPSPFDTVTTKTPEAMDSPQAPGMTPGSTNDVAADATTTVYQPGADIEGPAFKNLIDVTTPVAGTQGPQPLGDVRTQTDVRVGDPNSSDVAFPLQGEFANAERLNTGGGNPRQGSRSEEGSRRTFACLRLVEARAKTGDDEAASGNQYALAAAIEKDATRSTSDIEREVQTLTSVAKRMPSTPSAPPASSRSLVPRAASQGGRAVPSMRSEASHSGVPVGNADTEDSDLFME